MISKSVKKDTKKTQASILTKGKIVYSGNLHNPFQSAIAVFYFVQGGGAYVGFAQLKLVLLFFLRLHPKMRPKNSWLFFFLPSLNKELWRSYCNTEED